MKILFLCRTLYSDCSVGLVIYSNANEDFSGQSKLLQMLYALILTPLGLSLASGYMCYMKRKRAARFTEAEENLGGCVQYMVAFCHISHLSGSHHGMHNSYSYVL